ncbi:MAG: single-stranded-DNA-specific exonuclease RecJ [Spirochaetales bacterium]|nr:single-stranded-DNA-specific exonuclease RecJ [Spirochaetales bacterium]
MTWQKKEISPEEVREMARTYNIDTLTASILVRRDVRDPAELCYFLEEDLRYLHNPFLFEDMEIVVDRLQAAREESEKVLVFGDRDVDGMTSTALMVQALRDLDLDPEWRVPAEGENYGLSVAAVEDFAAREGTLIITVDNGITCFAEVDRANELGVDVLIFDHHDCRDTLPDALAIVNPKKPGTAYPFARLAGCGVVSKVLWALALSGSDYYNQSLAFLVTRQEGEELVIEMLKMVNLRLVSRLTVRSGSGEKALYDMVEFLKGEPIFVFSEREEKQRMGLFLGAGFDIHLIGLDSEISQYFPPLRGQSLEGLRQKSRMALYGMDGGELVDVLASLFVSLFLKKENSRFQVWAGTLDLVALGTVADMMPLLNENRILVKRGLDLINRSMRKNLREILLRRKVLDRSVRAEDLSWYVSPWLNAAGRMDRADLAVEFLLTDDEKVIYDLANRIDELYRKRREVGDTLWDQLRKEAEESLEECGGKLVYLVSDSIPRGITGILAARFSQYYHVPAMIVSLAGEAASGSVRAMDGGGITPLLEQLASHFDDWGGHEFAAGFSLSATGLGAFKRELIDRLRDFEPVSRDDRVPIDAELPPAYLNEDLEKLIEKLEPYGEAFPSLLFQSNNLAIDNVELVGKEGVHLKMLLATPDKKWPALFWNSVDRYKKDFNRDDNIDILFKLEKNFFRNRQTLQLNIQDLKRSET